MIAKHNDGGPLNLDYIVASNNYTTTPNTVREVLYQKLSTKQRLIQASIIITGTPSCSKGTPGRSEGNL